MRLTLIHISINANLGNISYVICAVAGGALAIGGYTGLTLGKMCIRDRLPEDQRRVAEAADFQI